MTGPSHFSFHYPFISDSCLLAHYFDKRLHSPSMDTYWDILRLQSSQLDLSPFPLSHILYSDPRLSEKAKQKLLTDQQTNFKRTGLFSSEIADNTIKSAALIASKCYYLDFVESNRAPKVVTKGVVKSHLDWKIQLL